MTLKTCSNFNIKSIFIVLLLFVSFHNSNAQHKSVKTWIKTLCIGSDLSTEVSQSKAVKKALLTALTESNTSTRKALSKIDLSPKQVDNLLSRYNSDELIQLFGEIDNLSPRAMREMLLDLASVSKSKSKQFKNFIITSKENRLVYERISKNLGANYRTDLSVLEQISNGITPVKIKTINEDLLGKAIDNASYVKRKVSIDGLIYEGVFLELKNEAKLVTLSLPKDLIGVANDLQFVESTKLLKRQYLSNPEAFKKQLATSNLRILKRDKEIFNKHSNTIYRLRDQIALGTQNGDTELVNKSLKELRSLTKDITFIRTSKQKPFEMLEMGDIIKKQIQDIQAPSISTKGRVFGFVWHHSENKGVVELVEKYAHEVNKHTGGNALWNQGIR